MVTSFVKPQVVPLINWSHPLAKNLILCLVPEYGDLLTNIPPKFSGSASLATFVWGNGVRTPQTSTNAADGIGYNLPASAPLYGTVGDLSIVILANMTVVAPNGALFVVAQDSADSNESVSFQVGASSSTGQAEFHVNAAAGSGATSSAGFFSTSDGPTIYAVNRTATSGTVDYFKNGFAFQTGISSGQTGNINWNTKQPPVLFNYDINGSFNGSAGGYAGLAFVFNRTLTPTEHFELATNPLFLLDYGSNYLIFPPLLPGNGFTQYLEDNILNFFLRTQASFISKPTTIALALCSNSPGNSGTIANELPNTNGYARVPILVDDSSWSTPTSVSTAMQISNSNRISWPLAGGTGWGNITHIAVCDSTTWGAGNVLFSLQFANAATVLAGTQAYLNPGDLVIQLD